VKDQIRVEFNNLTL